MIAPVLGNIPVASLLRLGYLLNLFSEDFNL
jgi:hypothetical protein